MKCSNPRTVVVLTLLALPILMGQGCPPIDKTPDGGGPGNVVSPLPAQATLAAAEAKRYSIAASKDDTVIVNSVVPDAASDVDLYLYGPDGNTELASSARSAGQPDNIRCQVRQSGTHYVDVVNIKRTSVTCQLASNRIASSSSSSLNGIYRITTANGTSVPSSVQEKWVFRDGRLVSRYVFIEGSLFNVSEDLELWADHTPGASTAYYWGPYSYLLKTISSTTSVTGSSVSFSFSTQVTYSGAGESGTFSADNQFTGQVSSDRRSLSGQIAVSGYANTQPFGYQMAVGLSRE